MQRIRIPLPRLLLTDGGILAKEDFGVHNLVLFENAGDDALINMRQLDHRVEADAAALLDLRLGG